MRIQHNIAALNSYRQLNTNNNNVAKNLEKLSSGYRINRAGDDAAGLAISEKMRAQIKGLETAQKNAQDGISLIQTAEGNLQEVHSMLNRMVELATQASNGTYSDANRAELQKEISSLNDEIDRIAQSANFNGLKLLDGSLGGASKAGSLTGASIIGFKGAETDAITGADASATPSDGAREVFEMTIDTAIADGKTVVLGGITITADDSTADTTAGAANAATATLGIKSGGADDADKQAAKIAEILNGKTGVAAADYTWRAEGSKLIATAKAVGTKTDLTDGGNSGTTSESVTTQGAAAAGIDYFAKDTINVDGTEVKVDWSQLSDTDKAALQQNWTASSETLAKAAAKVMQDTINQAIKDHNAQNGTNLNEIKVTGDASGDFVFASGQKDGASKLSFTGSARSVLGLVANSTGGITSNDPVQTLAPAVADLNGHFDMKLDDQVMDVNLQGVTGAGDIAAQLQAAIDQALANDDTAKGRTGEDALSGKIRVSVNNDGALEFINNTGMKLSFEDKNDGEFAKNLGISTEGKAMGSGGLTLQVGDTNEDFQKITVSVSNMDAESLGLSGINISTQTGAASAIDAINKAIDMVSSTRGDLGALQNRLDHTLNNLGVAVENITAAESRIRDTDMAKEMMDFTKNNILTQAAQAMLAQANMVPQSVLQLLQ